MSEIKNGQRWKQTRFPHCEGTVQWMDADVWCFMSMSESGIYGWPVCIPTSDRDVKGKIFYTADQLLARFKKYDYAPADMVVAA